MGQRQGRWHGISWGLLWLSVALAAGGGCGRRPAGKWEDLFISQERYVVDEKRETVYIYGRVDNNGPGHFEQIEIQATLISNTGAPRGENSVLLTNIRPYEHRLFALTVTSHGHVSDVVLQIRPPETP